MARIRKGIERREFLQLTAATPGLALWGCGAGERSTENTADREIPYRPLGNTGLRVSEVTFGAHGVDNPPVMRAAIEAGVNTFFTSGDYLDGREEESLRRAIDEIGGRRDDLVLISGCEARRGSSQKKILGSIDASLRRLRTDHLDIWYFQVESPENLRIEALFEAFEEARRAGKVGHLGLSGHSGGMQPCLNAAIDDGRFEVMLFKYDFVSYPDQAEILRRAAERGIGAIVFKVNAGNRQKEIRDLEAGGLSFQQATVKWALTSPDVSSVAVTITNFDQIRELKAAVDSPLSTAEVDMLNRYREEMADKYCRFCRTCESDCPNGVAVADVMRFAMYFKYYGREKEAMQRYRTLQPLRAAAACEGCRGACDAGCPFGRRVRAELVEAHRLLSFRVA